MELHYEKTRIIQGNAVNDTVITGSIAKITAIGEHSADLVTTSNALLTSITQLVTGASNASYTNVVLTKVGTAETAGATIGVSGGSNQIVSITITSDLIVSPTVGDVLSIAAGALGAGSTEVLITLVSDDILIGLMVDARCKMCYEPYKEGTQPSNLIQTGYAMKSGEGGGSYIGPFGCVQVYTAGYALIHYSGELITNTY